MAWMAYVIWIALAGLLLAGGGYLWWLRRRENVAVAEAAADEDYERQLQQEKRRQTRWQRLEAACGFRIEQWSRLEDLAGRPLWSQQPGSAEVAQLLGLNRSWLDGGEDDGVYPLFNCYQQPQLWQQFWQEYEPQLRQGQLWVIKVEGVPLVPQAYDGIAALCCFWPVACHVGQKQRIWRYRPLHVEFEVGYPPLWRRIRLLLHSLHQAGIALYGGECSHGQLMDLLNNEVLPPELDASAWQPCWDVSAWLQEAARLEETLQVPAPAQAWHV